MQCESDFNTTVEWHQNRSLRAMGDMGHFHHYFLKYFSFLLRLTEITNHMTHNKVP